MSQVPTVVTAPSDVDAKQKAYDAKPVFGRFEVLRGKHQEGGKTYKKGEFVDSKSDLNKLNGTSPGSQKFKQVGVTGEQGKKGVVPFQSAAAPGGQVSSGFQQSTTGSDGEQVSGPMPYEGMVLDEPKVGPAPTPKKK